MAVKPEAHTEMPGPWPRTDLISLSGPSETLAIYQLAARWAERYAEAGDDLATMLARFRKAYNYLDAVIHGLEPPDG